MMNQRESVSINLQFAVETDGSAAWKVSVPDPATEGHTWAVQPTVIPARVAVAVARTIDLELGHEPERGPGRFERMVHAQHSRVAEALRGEIARKRGLLEGIEKNEATLTALVEALDLDEQP